MLAVLADRPVLVDVREDAGPAPAARHRVADLLEVLRVDLDDLLLPVPAVREDASSC